MSQTLHLQILVHQPQRKLLVLAVVLVQIFPLDRDLTVRLILLQVPIPIKHVHGQAVEAARDSN